MIHNSMVGLVFTTKELTHTLPTHTHTHIYCSIFINKHSAELL